MSPKTLKRPARAPEATNDTLRHLSQCGTRTGLSSALGYLAEAGWLCPKVMKDATTGVRRKMSKAVADHAKASTPYGNVVQQMALPLAKLPLWDYVHPMALLYYLALISTAFGSMMEESVTLGVPMRVIIYIDDMPWQSVAT